MSKTIYFTVFMLFILASCGNGNDAENSVRFITDWEYDSPLSEDDSFQCDEIGVNGIRVVDSLIVVSHRMNWSVFTEDGKKKYANFLSVGQGPAEFVYSVSFVESSCFKMENDSLVAYIPNNYRGNIVRANITDLLSGGTGKLKERAVNPSLKKAWATVVCDSTSVMMSLPNDSITGFTKYFCAGDSMSIVKGMETVDALRVKSRDNINLLANLIIYNNASGKFVETKAFLNWINIFSNNGDELKTICVGKKMFNLEEMDKKEINYDEDTYKGAAAWDKGFGVICVGDLISASRPFKSDTSDLLVFDWDGNPVYRTKIPYSINAFDIDWANRRLIVHDEVNDRVLAYDASPIIERFK